MRDEPTARARVNYNLYTRVQILSTLVSPLYGVNHGKLLHGGHKYMQASLRKLHNQQSDFGNEVISDFSTCDDTLDNIN